MPLCSCCGESLILAGIALAAVVGASVVWDGLAGRRPVPRVWLLMGVAALAGAGSVACRPTVGRRTSEPACPCMAAARQPSPAPAPAPAPAAARELSPSPSSSGAAPGPEAQAAKETGEDKSANSPVLPPDVVVYYFHRKARCHSCIQIEEWARQVVETEFATPLDIGLMEWHSVDVESPGNEHFIEDYGLENQSLVVVRFGGGKAQSWKNLDRVWGLLGDNPKFTGYVRDELSAMLNGPTSAPNP